MVHRQTHGDAAGMPAARNESMPSPAFSCALINMKRLRVKFSRKVDYRRLVNAMRSSLNNLPDVKINELHCEKT